MKKKFQLFLILFLTYAFICCPVFARSSFAAGEGNEDTSPVTWKQRIENFKETAIFIKDSLPEWLQDLALPPLTSEDMKTNKETRKQIKEDIIEKLGITRKR